ncbi:hypothetical protein KFL_000510050 [Klebsormidium nitens]|uniref:Uncharacterized protein n=1 Tax=Klebsormidium nitens TaxID=105231 RepID=A0A1Y1HNS8_KLENI|nr:hypothetical protein KFL_000510050 [Klebsormidium nitens]|eukprot:GAQ80305.1 hypothetical protein KFL_000510050 [Klebsormidium nitens]
MAPHADNASRTTNADKIDEVSRNATWREHLKKELKRPTVVADYHLPDPRLIETLTDKPNRVNPHIKITAEDFENATSRLASMCTLKDDHLLPSEKYELPQTSAQEYGWVTKPLLERNMMFSYPRRTNEIMEYAAHYHAMTGAGQHAKKQGQTQSMKHTSAKSPAA